MGGGEGGIINIVILTFLAQTFLKNGFRLEIENINVEIRINIFTILCVSIFR